jgi:hypothetical protein
VKDSFDLGMLFPFEKIFTSETASPEKASFLTNALLREPHRGFEPFNVII